MNSTDNLVRITRIDQATVICPQQWRGLPTDEVRTGMTPVAGGAMLLDAARPDQGIGAELTDLDAAAWWLAGVFGEPVALAVLEGATDEESLVRAEWGPLAWPLRRLALASWLYRWWPSASAASAITRLDAGLLLAEIGTAAWQCEPCVPDDTVFSELLSISALPVGRAIGRLAERSGAELEAAEQLVWTSARAVLEEGDPRQAGWPALSDAWQRKAQIEDAVASLLAELSSTTRAPAVSGVALTAGEAQEGTVVETQATSVDWAQVNPRMVANQPNNVATTISQDAAGRRVRVQVLAGDEPAVEGLRARVYRPDGGQPLAQLSLELVDGVYAGSVALDVVGPVEVDVYHRDHVVSPRTPAQADADRDFVQQLVRDRLTSPLANPAGPFACELLGSDA